MSLPIFDLGDVAQVSILFTDRNGRVKDPDTVELELRGTQDSAPRRYVYGTDSELTRSPSPRTGYYEALLIPPYAGIWTYRWQSTGNPETSEGGAFYVLPSQVN